MPVAFDTLKAAKRLLDAAGFSEKQAGVFVSTLAKGLREKLAEGLGKKLATKANSKAEFHAVRSVCAGMQHPTSARRPTSPLRASRSDSSCGRIAGRD